MKTDIPKQFDDAATPVREDLENVEAYERQPAYAEKNPEYTDITDDVLSKFIFYPFNTLSIKPFTIESLKKVYRSIRLKSSKGIIDAISASLEPDVSAYDLTENDFWALMIWQRIYSYKKADFRIPFTCTNPKHIKEIDDTIDLEDDNEDGTPNTDKVDIKTLYNEKLITAFKNLEVKELTQEKINTIVNKVTEVHEKYGVYLSPLIMRDVMEQERLEDNIQKRMRDTYSDDPVVVKKIEDKNELLREQLSELEFSSKYASHLQTRHGDTLQERIEFINSQPADLIQEIDEFISLLDYGLSEEISVNCEHCGHREVVKLKFDILTFFPGNY